MLQQAVQLHLVHALSSKRHTSKQVKDHPVRPHLHINTESHARTALAMVLNITWCGGHVSRVSTNITIDIGRSRHAHNARGGVIAYLLAQ